MNKKILTTALSVAALSIATSAYPATKNCDGQGICTQQLVGVLENNPDAGVLTGTLVDENGCSHKTTIEYQSDSPVGSGGPEAGSSLIATIPYMTNKCKPLGYPEILNLIINRDGDGQSPYDEQSEAGNYDHFDDCIVAQDAGTWDVAVDGDKYLVQITGHFTAINTEASQCGNNND